MVAKLDRLARNVAFTSALMESGVDFVCCDNPHANRLTIHILAAVAEDEARRISERRKPRWPLQGTWREAGCRQTGMPQPLACCAEEGSTGCRGDGETKADEAYRDLRELFVALRPTARYRKSPTS